MVHKTKIMWPELFRRSGKPFSPRARSAKEEEKQRQRELKRRETFSSKDFLRQISEPCSRTRESAGRILRVVSSFIYPGEERHHVHAFGGDERVRVGHDCHVSAVENGGGEQGGRRWRTAARTSFIHILQRSGRVKAISQRKR